MSLYISSTKHPAHCASGYDACSSIPQNGVAPQQTRNILGDQETEAVMAILPEMQKLESILDSYYYKLHDDKKLLRFSNFFSKILVDNPAAFKDRSANQKAQILFDKYRELTIERLLKTPDYQVAYQALQQKVGEWIENSTLTEKVYKSYLSRIHQLHSDFFAFAVANSLQSKPSLISLSSDYHPRNLNFSQVQSFLL